MTGMASDQRTMTASSWLTLSDRVLDAARWAWETHGEQPSMQTTPVNGHAQMRSLAANHARRVEFVVADDDIDVWQILAQMEPVQAWQLCALVPLSMLGVAHERLGGCGFELQGWWLDGERVAFGNTEIA